MLGKLLTAVRLIHLLVVITAMMISQWRLGKDVVTGQVKDKEGKPVVWGYCRRQKFKSDHWSGDDGPFPLQAEALVSGLQKIKIANREDELV